MSKFDPIDKSLGQIAYEALNGTVTWKDLPEEYKSNWERNALQYAQMAVRDYVSGMSK